MPAAPLSDEDAIEAAEAMVRYGTQAAAAEALGLSRPGFQNRLRRATERGFYTPAKGAPPGYVIDRHAIQYDAQGRVKGQSIRTRRDPGDTFTVPEGHAVKGFSALLDSQGRTLQQWVKTREGERDPEWIAETLRTAFEGMDFAAPLVAPPVTFAEDCLALFKAADLHMGLYVHGAEAGENWDLKKSIRIYRAAFTELVAMTPSCGTAVLLGGGDQMHADSASNRTEASGHALDVDGRYERVLLETCEWFLFAVTHLLQRHEKVIVRILKGNHDPHSAAAIAFFLLAAFRAEPRVTIDVSPSLFWVHQFGLTMIAATHGHQARPQQMPGIMAARWADVWGTTRFRYAHVFHVHHRSKIKPQDELGGAIVETHQSPAPQDAWHYGMGYLAGRSFTSTVYRRSLGEVGRYTQPVLPEE